LSFAISRAIIKKPQIFQLDLTVHRNVLSHKQISAFSIPLSP